MIYLKPSESKWTRWDTFLLSLSTFAILLCIAGGVMGWLRYGVPDL